MSTCPNSPSGEHCWCPCFGACPCNRADCTLCGASRPLTDDERRAKAVPKDVLDAARTVDEYLRGDAAQAERARAWDEGWQELVEQERMQREDSSHPITRTNPYRKETNE